MTVKVPSQTRPGGRSARIQATVYQTVKRLLESQPREALNFPLIAAEAGVTPSTLYRRWGDLQQLLADVAVDLIRPTAPPLDTGTLQGDLLAWMEQFLEESASPLGRSMLRDMAAATANDQPCACVDILRGQLQLIAGRAAQRGESAPPVETLLDALAAPVVYRVLFDRAPQLDEACARVRGLLAAQG